jgi:aminoglycoside 6'-N-acetyltransferase I
VIIRPVTGDADVQIWAALRHKLWPHASAGELLVEAQTFASGGDSPLVAAAFIADDEAKPMGFIELSIRPFADGCDSRPIPHVEGWYVEPNARRQGVARALMERVQEWARERGFYELASDTEVENEPSLQAHARCGFAETERLVKFRKQL